LRKRWAARPCSDIDIKEASNPMGLPGSISLLLARRGFTGERLQAFMDPGIHRLSQVDSIPGSDAAADEIASAVREGLGIMVHGDFDADGITSTAVVSMALAHLGAEVTHFIPDRFIGGYGLGENGLELCESSEAQLLITVDCGTTAVEEVERLRSMNVGVVITDHHQQDTELPPASAIVNPALHGSHSWSSLSGAGVAWMVMRGVYRRLGRDEEFLMDLLQLVAVGTVADVVDLVDDNRILVAQGLDRLRRGPLPGLAVLAESSSLDCSSVTSTDIAYRLAPRLNACGRIGHARDALALLMAVDRSEATSLVSLVERLNRRRRELDAQVLSQAEQELKGVEEPDFILLGSEGWHRGVIGIVASRLVSSYGVPGLIVSFEDGMGHGSARSVPGIPIHSILQEVQKNNPGIMESLGGHPMAAGFSLRRENFDLLRRELASILAGEKWRSKTGSVLYLDGRLEEEDYSAATVRAQDLLEPFGEGNRKPVWLCRGAYPVNWRTVGRTGDHLSCSFKIGSSIHRAIGFNMVNSQSLFNGRVDLAFTLALDTYRNDGSVQLVLKGIRRHRRRKSNG